MRDSPQDASAGLRSQRRQQHIHADSGHSRPAGIPKVHARQRRAGGRGDRREPVPSEGPWEARGRGAIRASAEGNGIPIGNATAAQTAASATGARGRTKTRATSASTAVSAQAARNGRRSRDERRLPAPDPRRNPPTTAAAASTGLPKLPSPFW